MRKVRGIIWGLVLIALGVVISLNVLGLTDIDLFFDGWWTLFIIVPCAINLISDRGKTGNLIGLAVGVILLLTCQDIVGSGTLWKLLLPFILIVVGVKVIWRVIVGDKTSKTIKELEKGSQNRPYGFTAFSHNTYNFDNQYYHGGELNAVFGGITYDLRNALIPEDCVIRATAIFGAITILLPENVAVKTTSASVFGGVSNRHKKFEDPDGVTVYIRGSGIFGGVDIK